MNFFKAKASILYRIYIGLKKRLIHYISLISYGFFFKDHYFTILARRAKDLPNKKVWNQLAKHYHQMHRTPPDIEYLNWICDYISNRQYAILEYGCGNGCNLVELKKRGYGNLSGVDISEQFVEIAKKDCGADIDLNCDDFSNLNSGSYGQKDVIFTRAVLQHTSELELSSILKKFIALNVKVIILKEADLLMESYGRVEGHRVYRTYNHNWKKVALDLGVHHERILLASGPVQIFTMQR